MSAYETSSGPQVRPQSSQTSAKVVPISQAYRSVAGATQAECGCDVYEIALRITQVDRAIIRSYLHERCLALAAVGTRDRPQRSIWQRPLMPGGILSSKVRAQSLPAELECRLSAVPADYERVLVDHNVLLVKTATRKIVSVMRNACATDGLGRCVARERNPAPDMIDCSPGARDVSASSM
jgi:hypothetical protein